MQGALLVFRESNTFLNSSSVMGINRLFSAKIIQWTEVRTATSTAVLTLLHLPDHMDGVCWNTSLH